MFVVYLISCLCKMLHVIFWLHVQVFFSAFLHWICSDDDDGTGSWSYPEVPKPQLHVFLLTLLLTLSRLISVEYNVTSYNHVCKMNWRAYIQMNFLYASYRWTKGSLYGIYRRKLLRFCFTLLRTYNTTI